MTYLGVKGRELLLELKRSDWLPPYNDDGVKGVLREINALKAEIDDTMESTLDGEVEEEIPMGVRISLVVQHTSLLRNKRCALAYVVERLNRLRRLRWETGPIIPDALRINLSAREMEFFGAYSRLLADFQQSFGTGLDLTADMEPPKGERVQVRAKVDCGEIFTDTGTVRLEKGTTHFLRRSDVDHLIRQGLLEHIYS